MRCETGNVEAKKDGEIKKLQQSIKIKDGKIEELNK